MCVSVCCVRQMRVRPAHPPPPPLQPGTRQMPSLPPCRGRWSPALLRVLCTIFLTCAASYGRCVWCAWGAAPIRRPLIVHAAS
ncbi:hypothetical protein GQ607_001771 [Colletotrichum asianum]|uniref:Uncharacterized protein n=1 Tax=Colletotrichum asianum TaxID=702518 RepID=A0A8H3WU07_9PEZI|nr:hypothetical protein GQ607_001771 [Colletotrichum asianum]